MKANTARVASAGRMFGSITVQKMRKCPAPSRAAASSSSVGTWFIAWRSRKIPNALAKVGSSAPR